MLGHPIGPLSRQVGRRNLGRNSAEYFRCDGSGRESALGRRVRFSGVTSNSGPALGAEYGLRSPLRAQCRNAGEGGPCRPTMLHPGSSPFVQRPCGFHAKPTLTSTFAHSSPMLFPDIPRSMARSGNQTRSDPGGQYGPIHDHHRITLVILSRALLNFEALCSQALSLGLFDFSQASVFGDGLCALDKHTDTQSHVNLRAPTASKQNQLTRCLPSQGQSAE